MSCLPSNSNWITFLRPALNYSHGSARGTSSGEGKGRKERSVPKCNVFVFIDLNLYTLPLHGDIRKQGETK